MASVDFRKCLYALSGVIINRPKPLRVFDQIYMKLPDMLLQAELISRWFKDKKVLFVGDGDAIGLSLVHLAVQELLSGLPEHITVLDFDERVVNSANDFARQHEISDRIHGELYNVADPLPKEHWQHHDAFYTNPPWGASNDGTSVVCFIRRGIEAVKPRAWACVVIGDHSDHPWTHRVQHNTQRIVLDQGFRMAEMLPEFHRYHLDDEPNLTSCSMLFARESEVHSDYASQPLSADYLKNFYGQESPLRCRYVRDLTSGGMFQSRDVKLEPLEGVN